MKATVKFVKNFFQNLGVILIPAILVVYLLGIDLIRVAKDMLLDQVTFIPDRNIPINFNSNIDFLVFSGLSILAIVLIAVKTSKESEVV